MKERPAATRIGQRCRLRPLRLERLESRALLRPSPLFWADTSQLTLSFVEDGTDIAGQPSSLHEMMAEVAPHGVWQRTVLQGFQTWAEQTGSDVGVVPEQGNWPLGTDGPRTRDSRFGDIRIGARPLSSEVKAIAVAHDTIVAGTWGGDVIFNSDATFDGLRDVFAVSLHEAGHVFGLEHSDDPQSPMYEHGGSHKTVPTDSDLEDLQTLHGVRLPDNNEGEDGNETIDTATPLQLNLSAALDATVASHLLYGDITTAEDIDVYAITLPRNARGPLRLRIQSQSISLLHPSVRVIDTEGKQLAAAESVRNGGATLNLTVHAAEAQQTYFVEIGSVPDSRFRVGGYSLVTAFGTLGNLPTRDGLVDKLAVARERKLSQNRLQQLVADNTSVLDRIENVNDSLPTASDLPRQAGFDLYARYEALGSIHPEKDQDYYVFRAADLPGRASPILNVTVRSLSAGRLVPEATLFNRAGVQLPVQVLVNGNGELVFQAAVVPEQRLYLRVKAAAESGPFSRGNYRVTATFVEDPIELVVYAAGRVGDPRDSTAVDTSPINVIRPLTDVASASTQSTDAPPADKDETLNDDATGPSSEQSDDPIGMDNGHNDGGRADENDDRDTRSTHRSHVVYVATPQLFHWILGVGSARIEEPEAVFATLFNQDRQLVHQLSTKPGQIRTKSAVLLMPGTYYLRLDAVALNGQPANRLRFQLQGLTISDPFAVDPEDPSTDPFFECPDIPDMYCYPGGIISDDPFLWDDFLDTLPEIPELEPSELIEVLLGDWWSWYWDQTGNYTPPLAVDDTFSVPFGETPVVVPASQGVLSNDAFDSEATQLALLAEDVSDGQLQLAMDGSFVYTPEPDFVGTVSFRYWASDVQSTAGPAKVAIQITDQTPGDLNDDFRVNLHDVDLLCAAIMESQVDPLFDLNQDGGVDLDDFDMMIEDILLTSAGDANLDGSFNSTDLVAVFGVNQYEDSLGGNSNWSSGDWNCDGEFTSTDLIVAFQTGRYEQVVSG